MKNKEEEIILKMRSIIKSISLLEQNIVQLKLQVSELRLILLEEYGRANFRT
jgi:wobble nucleotide-excising tRNase